VGFGRFEYPSWHKEEKEDILKSTNIEVKRADHAMPDDRRYGVGDFEHSEIIEKYMELKSEGKTAVALGRSSRTIHVHIQKHNLAIEKIGECSKCHHSKSPFSKDSIIGH
jgi:hypothetical protein